jgi:hypothetical protein
MQIVPNFDQNLLRARLFQPRRKVCVSYLLFLLGHLSFIVKENHRPQRSTCGKGGKKAQLESIEKLIRPDLEQPSTKHTRKQVEGIPEDVADSDMAPPLSKRKKQAVSEISPCAFPVLRLVKKPENNRMPSKPERPLQGASQPVLQLAASGATFGLKVPAPLVLQDSHLGAGKSGPHSDTLRHVPPTTLLVASVAPAPLALKGSRLDAGGSGPHPDTSRGQAPLNPLTAPLIASAGPASLVPKGSRLNAGKLGPHSNTLRRRAPLDPLTTSSIPLRPSPALTVKASVSCTNTLQTSEYTQGNPHQLQEIGGNSTRQLHKALPPPLSNDHNEDDEGQDDDNGNERGAEEYENEGRAEEYENDDEYEEHCRSSDPSSNDEEEDHMIIDDPGVSYAFDDANERGNFFHFVTYHY